MKKKNFLLVMALSLLVSCGTKPDKSETATNEKVSIGDYVTCKNTFEITEGDEIDANKFCTISDKTYKPEISVKTDVDTSKAGKGDLTVTVTDEQGNIFMRTVNLIVKAKATPTSKTTPTPTPETKQDEQVTDNSDTSQQASQANNNYDYSNNSQTYVAPETNQQNTQTNTQTYDDDDSGYVPYVAPSTNNNSSSSNSSSGTQYFMFSNGYNMDSAASACVAWASSISSSYSCEPIADGSGTYIGYRGTAN